MSNADEGQRIVFLPWRSRSQTIYLAAASRTCASSAASSPTTRSNKFTVLMVEPVE
jgi:hypothetical protein